MMKITFKNAKWSRQKQRGHNLCGNRPTPRHANDANTSAKRTFLCVFATIEGCVVLMVSGTKVVNKVGQNNERLEKSMK